MMNFDSTDLKILRELQRDSSLSNVELAKRVNLSPSPCLTRVKALEASGCIREYVALLEPEHLGLRLNVFISISLKQQGRESLQNFERKVCECDEVMECYLMTGDADYLIRVVMPDMQALENFIIERLSPMPEVEKIRSSLCLKQVRYKTALPLRKDN
ncbi:Lrp/AsnC family transcriptional regulator [Pseudomonas sp. NFX15]|uniref:Lrp/AsnC family transcriptional regulator n=1 Tax=Pseudomonas sp. NFX15 TaxID=2816958 RepID=UPI003B8C1EE7